VPQFEIWILRLSAIDSEGASRIHRAHLRLASLFEFSTSAPRQQAVTVDLFHDYRLRRVAPPTTDEHRPEIVDVEKIGPDDLIERQMKLGN
jgi:hypothetical protein